MRETITHLEMTGRDQLSPARPVEGVVLDTVDGTSPLIREMTLRIGAPYGWPSQRWSDTHWARRLSDPHRRYRIVRWRGQLAGLAECEIQSGGDVEITTFGLVPECTGRGIGGHALTEAVRWAWALEPSDASTVHRIWLHTSDLDHPHALPCYLARGFRPFRTEQGDRPGCDGR